MITGGSAPTTYFPSTLPYLPNSPSFFPISASCSGWDWADELGGALAQYLGTDDLNPPRDHPGCSVQPPFDSFSCFSGVVSGGPTTPRIARQSALPELRARAYDLRSPSSCSGTLVLCLFFFGSGGLRAIRPRWRIFVPFITYVARTFARGEPDVGKGELCQIPCCPSFACADRLGPGGNRLSRPALLWRWRGSRHWFSSLWWWCVHTLICELIATASDTHNPHPHPFPPPTRKPERGLAGPWAVCFWSGGLGLEDRVMGCRAVERGHHVIRTFTRAKRD